MAKNPRYHHGDLRRGLVEAAGDLLRERGVEEVTLRAIARRAEVSHAAPYHHFADLNSLLAAVSAAGFIRLREAMLNRAHASQEEPLSRLQEAGVAYVGFAAENPELYRLMFSGRLREMRDDPELSQASGAAYEALGELLLETGKAQPGGAESGLNEAAQAAWAMVHGLAMLLIDKRLDIDPGDREQVEKLARRLTRVLGRGLRSQK